MRMQLLRVVASFGTEKNGKANIYSNNKSDFKGSCPVWDGSLTSKNRKSLERIQKQCLRIIHHNLNYKQALKQLNIEEMQTRRTMLTLRFTKLKKK